MCLLFSGCLEPGLTLRLALGETGLDIKKAGFERVVGKRRTKDTRVSMSMSMSMCMCMCMCMSMSMSMFVTFSSSSLVHVGVRCEGKQHPKLKKARFARYIPLPPLNLILKSAGEGV